MSILYIGGVLKACETFLISKGLICSIVQKRSFCTNSIYNKKLSKIHNFLYTTILELKYHYRSDHPYKPSILKFKNTSIDNSL